MSSSQPETDKTGILRTWLSKSAAGILPAVAGVMLVMITIISFNGGISVGASNHFGQLPVVRRVLDPNYLPGDFSIEIRWYHHRAFTYIIAGLSWVFGEDWALILLHIAGMSLLTLSLWYLCKVVGIPLPGFMAVGFCLATNFLWTGLGLELNHFVGDAAIMPPTFSHAYVLLALAVIIRGRYLWAAIYTGLAALFHLQIGLIAGVMIAPFYLLNFRRIGGFRGLLTSLLLFVLPAAPGLFDLIRMMQGGLAAAPSSGYTLPYYIDFRHPHHFELISSTAALWVAGHTGLMVLVYVWLRRKDRPEARYAGEFLLATVTLGIFCIIHFVDYYIIRDDRFASIQFIRLSPLISVLGMTSLVLLLKNIFNGLGRSRLFPTVMVLLMAATLAWGYFQVRAEVLIFNPGISKYEDRTSTWVRVCKWVKENGPKDAVYLSPPGNNGFSSLSERSNVADFKNNTDGGMYMTQWFDRLKDLAGGRLPDGRGFENRDLLNEAYEKLSAEQLISIGEKYNAEYAVIFTKTQVPFHSLYENSKYKVIMIPLSSK